MVRQTGRQAGRNTISNALISSRLDYCNSLINNIAKQDLSKLQRVQNCLARVILRAPRFSPSLPLLKQLHWLPVNYRTYMSTHREVLEGQTGSHRAKRANFGRGARGSTPGKFQKPTMQMVQSMLFLSYIL